MDIVLASQSPRRKELLSQIGVSFICHASEKEEMRTSEEPEAVVMELSAAKARDVAAYYGNEGSSIIIGADTVVSVDGEILGKPKDREDAIRMIGRIQGRSHDVFTGVTLIGKVDGTTVFEQIFANRTEVMVCPMGKGQIEDYVDSGESMDKAGAYGIQGAFAAYVMGIKGDYNNVVGLPVCAVYQRILELGVDLIKGGKEGI